MSMCRRKRSAIGAGCWSPTRPAKSNVLAELERLGIEFDSDDPRVDAPARRGQGARGEGYAYEGADASFLLLAAASSARCRTSSRSSASASTSSAATTRSASWSPSAEAIVKVEDRRRGADSAAEGNGPVNALDLALRKDLGKFQHHIADLELRRLQGPHLPGRHRRGDARADRVRRSRRRRWSTVGVSANIIDASFQALIDSIIYKLMKSGAT